MSINHERELERLLKEDGARLVRSKTHLVYYLSNGKTFTRSKTPSDTNIARVDLGCLRRLLRGDNPPIQPPVHPPVQPVHPPVQFEQPGIIYPLDRAGVTLTSVREAPNSQQAESKLQEISQEEPMPKVNYEMREVNLAEEPTNGPDADHTEETSPLAAKLLTEIKRAEEEKEHFQEMALRAERRETQLKSVLSLCKDPALADALLSTVSALIEESRPASLPSPVHLPAKTRERMNTGQRKTMVCFLADHGQCDVVNYISENLQWSVHDCRRVLESMVKEGYVERDGDLYRLTSKGWEMANWFRANPSKIFYRK